MERSLRRTYSELFKRVNRLRALLVVAREEGLRRLVDLLLVGVCEHAAERAGDELRLLVR